MATPGTLARYAQCERGHYWRDLETPCLHCLSESSLEIRHELDAIKALLIEIRDGSGPRQSAVVESSLLDTLLQAVVGACGDGWFTTSELLRDPAFGAITRMDSAQLGCFLRDHVNRKTPDRLMLESGSKVGNRRLFRVVRILP